MIRLLLIVCSLLGVSLQTVAQTAFNERIPTEDGVESGTNDIVIHKDRLYCSVIYYYDDADQMGIAEFDRYGNRLWFQDMTYLDYDGHLASRAIEIISDSLFLLVQTIYDYENVVPDIPEWPYNSVVSVYEKSTDALTYFFPDSGHDAFRIHSLEANSVGQLVAFGNVIDSGDNYSAFDTYVNVMDTSGATLYEANLIDYSYQNRPTDLLVLPDDRIITLQNNIEYPLGDYVDEHFRSFTVRCFSPQLELLWSRTVEGAAATSLDVGRSGDLLVGGRRLFHHVLEPYPHFVSHLAVFDFDLADGTTLWERDLYDEDVYHIICMKVHETEDGRYQLAGRAYDYAEDYLPTLSYTTTAHVFWLELDTELEPGEMKWYKHNPEVQHEWITFAEFVPEDGGMLIGGTTEEVAGSYEPDIWLLKLDSLGNDYRELGALFVVDTIGLALGDSLLLDPIPYGGSNHYAAHDWTGSGSDYLDDAGVWYPIFTPAEAGSYELTYRVTDSDGNEAEAVLVLIVNDFLASSAAQQVWQPISLYPNPADGGFQIEFDRQLVGRLLVVVSDEFGRTVGRFDSGFGKSIQLNTADWIEGVYLLQLFEADGGLIGKRRVVVVH